MVHLWTIESPTVDTAPEHGNTGVVHCLQTSPADGLIVLCGEVIDGQLEQIKGVSYSLPGFIGPHIGSLLSHSMVDQQLFDVLGTEIDVDVARLLKCRGNRLYQCVVYLSPGEYHHFHSPADWIVTGRRHFPGILSRTLSLIRPPFNIQYLSNDGRLAV